MSYTIINLSLPGSTLTTRPEEVLLEVIFGTPSKHCRGLGICMIVEPCHLRGEATECPLIPGYFLLDTCHKTLSIRFDRTFLSSQMIARHFSRGLFKVTEPYKVPGRICRMLGAGSRFEIGTGVYSVFEDSAGWVVEFDRLREMPAGPYDIKNTNAGPLEPLVCTL